MLEKSPFHKGEQEAQTRLGVRERMERFGRQVIRDHMPAQHREFYQQLPFLFVGHGDKNGWPWASILTGQPGFISSNAATSLEVNALPFVGDPLNDALEKGTRIGVLGIELETRRRNRLATHIRKITDSQIHLHIDQAFGNCPQYIQDRKLSLVSPEKLPKTENSHFSTLDEEAKNLINESDTFFVASFIPSQGDNVNAGADVSHRGGRPGFIQIDDEGTLTIPDYTGNFHFNTFGNFIENPKAGLLFLDFEKGHILTLTGSVEILWHSPDTKYFSGAERLWTFKLDHGHWLKNTLPYRWNLETYSPNTLMTGTWKEAREREAAEVTRNQWLPYTVTNIVEEGSAIKSFYLKAEGHQQTNFKPGQYLTVKATINGKQLIRTYTLSSAPQDDFYRISVKKESSLEDSVPDGIFSNYLHKQIREGDSIKAKAPCGTFSLDSESQRPVVLLAGGIGITPMISMARYILMEGVRTRSIRQTTLFASFQDAEQRAFFDEISSISANSNGKITSFWALSKVDKTLKAGKDYHQHGRIDAEFLQAALAFDDYDFYLCGPTGFMQSMYNSLRKLGARDDRIYAEEFGPASLQRENRIPKPKNIPSAEEALVEFTHSKVEQLWSKAEGSLLEFAENHGFTPDFSCRRGQCGACKTKLISGKVVYNTEVEAQLNDDEVLICCAMPAKSEDGEISKVVLAM